MNDAARDAKKADKTEASAQAEKPTTPFVAVKSKAREFSEGKQSKTLDLEERREKH